MQCMRTSIKLSLGRSIYSYLTFEITSIGRFGTIFGWKNNLSILIYGLLICVSSTAIFFHNYCPVFSVVLLSFEQNLSRFFLGILSLYIVRRDEWNNSLARCYGHFCCWRQPFTASSRLFLRLSQDGKLASASIAGGGGQLGINRWFVSLSFTFVQIFENNYQLPSYPFPIGLYIISSELIDKLEI